jgi:ferredoxin-thioredoxin reductase catalytic subunit
MKLNSKNKEELLKSAEIYASSIEIKINPDKKISEGVAEGLLMKKKKFGDIYCPCRIVTKNKEKDKEIVCPCVFHRGEIELEGHCKCNLFVSR